MRRWDDNIKMDFKYVELMDVDWACLDQDMDYWLTLVFTGMDCGVFKC